MQCAINTICACAHTRINYTYLCMCTLFVSIPSTLCTAETSSIPNCDAAYTLHTMRATAHRGMHIDTYIQIQLVMTHIGQTYVLTHILSSLPSVPATTSPLREVRAQFETEVSATPIIVSLPEIARLTSLVTFVSRCQSRNDWSNWTGSQSVLTREKMKSRSHNEVRPTSCRRLQGGRSADAR